MALLKTYLDAGLLGLLGFMSSISPGWTWGSSTGWRIWRSP